MKTSQTKTSQPSALYYLPSYVLPSDLMYHHGAHAHEAPIETIHHMVSITNQVSPLSPTPTDNPPSTPAPIPLESVLHQTYLRKAKTLEKEPWSNKTNVSMSNSQKYHCFNDLVLLLRVLTNDSLFNASKLLLHSFNILLGKGIELDELIVKNIKEYCSHLTTNDSATINEKYNISKVVIGTDQSHFTKIYQRLGLWCQVYYNIVYNTIPSNHNQLTFMQKLQRECIVRFGHSDEASRIDSNSKRCINIINSDGSKEKHVG